METGLENNYPEISAANAAVWAAADKGDALGLETAIKDGADINFLFDGTYTALHLACSRGHLEAVKTLLQAGWDANLSGEIADYENNITFEGTPLHHVLLEIFNLFLRLAIAATQKWHITFWSKERILTQQMGLLSTTLLSIPVDFRCQLTQIATRSGHLKLLELLIEKGADIRAVDGAGESLINIAADFGHVNVIKFLLDKGFNANETSLIHTPIVAAAESGHLEAVKLLLANGAAINGTPEVRKDTALHAAAQNGFVEVVTFLLANKADSTLRNSDGKTPAEVATPEVKTLFL